MFRAGSGGFGYLGCIMQRVIGDKRGKTAEDIYLRQPDWDIAK